MEQPIEKRTEEMSRVAREMTEAVRDLVPLHHRDLFVQDPAKGSPSLSIDWKLGPYPVNVTC